MFQLVEGFCGEICFCSRIGKLMCDLRYVQIHRAVIDARQLEMVTGILRHFNKVPQYEDRSSTKMARARGWLEHGEAPGQKAR